MVRSLVHAAIAAGFPFLASTPSAADVAVDLELVLAVDISHSMDDEEQRLQRNGYIAAFRHPEVQTAIRAGRHRRIAVAYVEWAGTGRRLLTVPWTLVGGAETAERFAARLEAAPLQGASRTSVSGALEFSARLFEGNGYTGVRRVIDVSGDGPNNMGPRVDTTRDALVARGIVINGLPIMLKPSFMAGFADVSELNHYYQDCVIGGLGAFLVTVHKTSEFPGAIRRKLILEMSGNRPRVMRVQLKQTREKVDCLIGEKLWGAGWD